MRTLVFVDDEPHVLSGYRRSLQDLREDWELRFFDSAEAVLEHLQAHPVDR